MGAEAAEAMGEAAMGVAVRLLLCEASEGGEARPKL